LFTKEAKKTNKGLKPAIKTGITDQTNHCDAITAAVQIRGAAAQIPQETLLGFVFHFIVFIMYNKLPIE
jgi:hypothetical protein